MRRLMTDISAILNFNNKDHYVLNISDSPQLLLTWFALHNVVNIAGVGLYQLWRMMQYFAIVIIIIIIL